MMSRLPRDQRERVKVLVALPLIAICAIWLTIWIITSIDWAQPAQPPSTPGALIAIDLSKKLVDDLRFNDTGVYVETEKPLKLVVNGAVHSAQALDELAEFMRAARPEGDYTIDVVVIEHR